MILVQRQRYQDRYIARGAELSVQAFFAECSQSEYVAEYLGLT